MVIESPSANPLILLVQGEKDNPLNQSEKGEPKKSIKKVERKKRSVPGCSLHL